ncbi:MAG TPA: LamB/YcsF family protein [Fimbriimonadaceae bacterium]|nr:LamB/YcsF family protein [Fimbriimonadaceae bacterium]
MKRVDINVDMGEGFAFDDELLHIATSANVCCGAHAGSPELTMQTVEKCRRLGVRVGAHPGVPDRENMGRLPLVLEGDDDAEALLQSLRGQMRLASWDYVKAHGALYNACAVPGRPADVMEALLREFPLPAMAMPGTRLEEVVSGLGSDLIREGFADRRYTERGTLAPRSEPGSVLSDPSEIAAQVVRLAARVDSICIHGDSPGCVEIAALVRETLVANGYGVGP